MVLINNNLTENANQRSANKGMTKDYFHTSPLRLRGGTSCLTLVFCATQEVKLPNHMQTDTRWK